MGLQNRDVARDSERIIFTFHGDNFKAASQCPISLIIWTCRPPEILPPEIIGTWSSRNNHAEHSLQSHVNKRLAIQTFPQLINIFIHQAAINFNTPEQ